MLIDYFAERNTFSQQGLWLSVLAFLLAALTALIHRRWALHRAAKKRGLPCLKFRILLLRGLAPGFWAILFFLLTGCLKGPLQEDEPAGDKKAKRALFFSQVLHLVAGTLVAVLIHSVIAIFSEVAVIRTVMLFTGAFVCAYLSLLIFTLLPLPCSDAEQFLRTKEFSPKGMALRRQGTYPFLIHTTLALLLACIPVPVGAAVYSLSGLITMLPVFLIGG